MPNDAAPPKPAMITPHKSIALAGMAKVTQDHGEARIAAYGIWEGRKEAKEPESVLEERCSPSSAAV